jgi:dimethylaniline monooxygenase (N-oxide forming)
VTGERNRVGVIGAGIAGLVTAKVLRDDGYDVVVLEKEPAVGGVWAESRTYPGLRTNNSRFTYAFSDHPYARTADVFPTAEQVREYLASYVARFRLTPLVRLSTEVVRVSRSGTGFEITIRNPNGPGTLQCDFVAVCAGVFSEPRLPEIEGADRFAGALLHSSEATDPALFAGQRVIVVGGGKSALDCAAWAASHAQTCALVFRRPHWMAPRYLPGGIPGDWLYLTRLTESFLRYHRLSRFERFLHGPGKPLTRLFWRGASGQFRLLLRMPAVMVPDELLPAGFENLGIGQEAYDMARRDQLLARRDEIWAFPGGTEVLLASGERIAADVVIFATGWRQSLPFLASELQSAALRDGQWRLYRHILPPTEPRLGFIGYASSTACQLTSEVSAHWLSHAFRGDLTLPATHDMEAEVDRVRGWLGDALPARAQGYFIGPYLAHHIDDLVADMGVPTQRTSTFVTEYLGPVLPARYRGLAEERRLASSNGTQRRRRYYLSAGHATGALAALTLARAARRRRFIVAAGRRRGA